VRKVLLYAFLYIIFVVLNLMHAEAMETLTPLTSYELYARLCALYSIIDDGMRGGIVFDSLTEAVEAYCTPDFTEPQHYGCETFEEVAELLLQQHRDLRYYPNNPPHYCE
jgi:hypothetical protein